MLAMKRILSIAISVAAMSYGTMLTWSIPKWREIYTELYGEQPILTLTSWILSAPPASWVAVTLAIAVAAAIIGFSKHKGMLLLLPATALMTLILLTLFPLFMGLIVTISELK